MAAIVLASSCSTKMSLVKRKYNKGFYLAKSNSAAPKKVINRQTSFDLRETTNNHEVAVSRLLPEQATKTQVTKTDTRSFRNSVTGSLNHPQKAVNLQASSSEIPAGYAPSAKPLEINNNLTSKQKGTGDADVDLIILVILALLIPPLGVYLKDKAVNKWFWITLILCLLSLSFFVSSFLGILWLAAMVIAVLYVLDMI